MQKRVAIVQKLVPPYRVPIFEALTSRYDVIICHSSRKTKRNKPFAKNIDFPNLYLKSWNYRKADTAIVQNLIPLYLKVRPKVVFCDFGLGFASFWILLFTRRLFGFKLALWTHGVKGNQMDKPFDGVRGKVRLWLLNKSDGVVAYSEKRAAILKEYLKTPEKVFIAKNSIDTSNILGIHDRLDRIGQEKIKEELGISHRFNLLFLGRIQPYKEVDLLIREYSKIFNKHDVCLHVVGSGERKHLEELAKELNVEVRFYGAIYDAEELGKVLYACDLMMLPNAVGLAIVHSFAGGLPLLTTEMDPAFPDVYHNPEIEYLKPDINGIMCRKDQIAESLDKLLSDPEKLKSMKREALRTAREECSMENVVEGFRACMEYLGEDVGQPS